jgi:hypothetical protein
LLYNSGGAETKEKIMAIRLFKWLWMLIFVFFASEKLFSQQIPLGTPFNTLGNGYYERYVVTWGVNGRGGFASFGHPYQSIPSYGYPGATAGVQAGWAFGNPNFKGKINFSAAQGAWTAYQSQTPMLTLANGYPGAFSAMTYRPFVTGYYPYVAGYQQPYMTGYLPYGTVMQGIPLEAPENTPPLDRVNVMRRWLEARQQEKTANADEPVDRDPGEAMLPRRPNSEPARTPAPARSLAEKSSAERPAMSLTEAKRLHEQEKIADEKEIADLLSQAEEAERAGKPAVAKIYYQMIVRRADGEPKQLAERRLKELQTEKR